MTANNHGQIAVPCMMMRGGTSKAACFDAADLPPAGHARDALILAAMGYPDARQIDGIGGGSPLTTKVAVLSPSNRDDTDVDYLFAQVVPTESRIDYAPTCGNILAAVGPYAIERGWVEAIGEQTPVRIHMVNTGARCVANVPSCPGGVVYAGDAAISGVPGRGAPIYLTFEDIIGSTTGALFPTGRQRDRCAGVDVTCIDHGMPVVVLAAEAVGISGNETPAQLDANTELKARIEAIRLDAGALMGLGDVADKVIPKVTLVSQSRDGGTCSTRSFIPKKCHDAIGVLGAVSVASAVLLPGTVIASPAQPDASGIVDMSIEHPTGHFSVRLFRDAESNVLSGAALMRTARLLFRGEVLVPAA